LITFSVPYNTSVLSAVPAGVVGSDNNEKAKYKYISTFLRFSKNYIKKSKLSILLVSLRPRPVIRVEDCIMGKTGLSLQIVYQNMSIPVIAVALTIVGTAANVAKILNVLVVPAVYWLVTFFKNKFDERAFIQEVYSSLRRCLIYDDNVYQLSFSNLPL
jgi:hypothetical protein